MNANIAVSATVAATAFSWLLFVFAPAISVATGVFVANFIVTGSPVAENEGVEVEGGVGLCFNNCESMC